MIKIIKSNSMDKLESRVNNWVLNNDVDIINVHIQFDVKGMMMPMNVATIVYSKSVRL